MKMNAQTKRIVTITAVVVGGITTLFLLKKVAELLKSKQGKDTVKDAEKEIEKSDLSYTDSTYSTMASILFKAMEGTGTDYDPIKRVIEKLKTKSDWLKLVSTFGVKKVSNFVYDFEGSLVEWLIDELSDSQQVEISDILAKIGVTL